MAVPQFFTGEYAPYHHTVWLYHFQTVATALLGEVKHRLCTVPHLFWKVFSCCLKSHEEGQDDHITRMQRATKTLIIAKVRGFFSCIAVFFHWQV